MKQRLGLATLLAGLAMVSPFSIDTFFPSFGAIAAEFDVGAWRLQQTLTVYLVPYGVMALVHGPLSDAFGRRPVVIVGLSLYALASVACALAPGFVTLLAFRAVQGMTAGTGLVIGRAVIRDLYDGPQAQRLMSVVTLIFGVAPAVAPIVGGWIHVASGWRWVFGFMVLVGVVLVLASWLALPETHPPARRVPFHPAALRRTSWRIASHREFVLLALAAGLNFSAVIAFIGAAPAIVLRHWGLTETQFGWLFVPLIAGFMLGALLSGRVAGRLAPQHQVNGGFAISLSAAGTLLVVHALTNAPPIPLQQALLLAMGMGAQLVFPVLTLRMLDLFPEARGAAASVQSFFALMVTSLTMGLMVPALHGSLATLTAGSFGAAATSFLLWRTEQRIRPVAVVGEDAVGPPDL
jgi:DHA1 family bicyclomycin/chloramphenicol resistance-like MFS transporter